MEKETNHIPGIGDHPEETPLYGYRNREVFYFFDKGKGYIQKVEPHNNTVQVLIKQGWDIIEDKIEDMRKKAETGLVSPIAFHMERCLMDLVTLAGYSGIPKWKIKRHLKPSVYKKLDEKTKNRYAEVFGISIQEMEHFTLSNPKEKGAQ
jgi:hypothetical protein